MLGPQRERRKGSETGLEREKPRGSVCRSFRPLGTSSPPETPRSRRTRSPGESPVPPLGGASPVSVSYLTASPSNVNPPHHHRKPNHCFVFATTNPNFANRPNQPANQELGKRKRDRKPGPNAKKPRGSVCRSFRPLGTSSPPETPRSRRTRSPGGSPVPPLGGTSPVSELPHSQSQQCRTHPTTTASQTTASFSRPPT